mgnify:CR=1 FL=1
MFGNVGHVTAISAKGEANHVSFYGFKGTDFTGFCHDADTNRGLTRVGYSQIYHLRGFLFITGRASDMFISGGSNIYPLEIEEKIVAHPAVAEACVVGIPDEKWGEIGVAAVVLAPGARVTGEELRADLAGRIAGYKIPKRFEIVEALPRSGYGKVTKKLVREMIEERMALPRMSGAAT